MVDEGAAQCACGKPAEHLYADEASGEWACRVPEPEPVAQGFRDLYDAALPDDAPGAWIRRAMRREGLA